ncbi:hypothetical protein NIES2100_16160 [Calothrix sp. NIES-2100]|uniref:hypothetical protein n=1 Tax=Calothrix sp. NIES-2100 TaxID=1954172 RepID=UPI000B61F0AB|nr:hypothetical protein NIES2100_16160 [Calothrix sp. NIES-2100]
MRVLFKGERRNSEDSSPVSIWTFIDTGLEITQDINGMNMSFTPYSKIAGFSIFTNSYILSRDIHTYYTIRIGFVNEGFADIYFSDSEYAKSVITKIKEILQTKLS